MEARPGPSSLRRFSCPELPGTEDGTASAGPHSCLQGCDLIHLLPALLCHVPDAVFREAEDPVADAQRRPAVGDDHHGPAGQGAKVTQQALFVPVIQFAGGFIQKQHRAPGKRCTGDGKALSLLLREAGAPFPKQDVGIVHKFIRAGNFQCPLESALIPGGSGRRRGSGAFFPSPSPAVRNFSHGDGPDASSSGPGKGTAE